MKDLGVGEGEMGRHRDEDVQERRDARLRQEEEMDHAAGRRGKVRKERDYILGEDDRSFRRRVGSRTKTITDGSNKEERIEQPGSRVSDMRPGNAADDAGDRGREGEFSFVSMGSEQAGRNKPLLRNISDSRVASPSPKRRPHFSNACESGDSDSSGRSASCGLSFTPESDSSKKPTRATPGSRTRERFPSPRTHLPAASNSRPVGHPRLADNIVLTGGASGVERRHYSLPVEDGGKENATVELLTEDSSQKFHHAVYNGEELDRWVPCDDDDDASLLHRGRTPHDMITRERHALSDRKSDGRNQREYRWLDRGGRGDPRWNSKRRRGVHDSDDRFMGTSGRSSHGERSRRGGDTRTHRDCDRQRSGVMERVAGANKYDHNGKASSDKREAERESVRTHHLRGGAERVKEEKKEPPKSDKCEPPAEKKSEGDRSQLPPGRSGGVYIPPFKLAQMLREVNDKSSVEYQRLTWDALRKSINGLVNKVNASNLKNILPELFAENLIRGRGLFARSCMKSQMASPTFTHVFAALVAVVNTKFPELGELLLRRIVLQLRRAYKRNDKPVLLAAAKFIAHLVNQKVAHEILALELLTVLLEKPTDDSVEVAVGFIKECGATLQNLSSQGLHAIFERFRGILHEGEIDKRVQFMIEGLFAIRKANFQGYPGIVPELDLVEEDDQITHELSLSDNDLEDESYLDVFKTDPKFLENEKKYEAIKQDILGEDSEHDGGKEGDRDDESDEEDEDDEERQNQLQIQDETETNLVNLRRTIYLTIMSSVDFEEAGHKLLKIHLEPGQEMELCIMLLECCSQERTYLRYYGLLGQRFCMINKVYQENFDQSFVKQYSMIHRLETNKLRNVAKFFAHLLGTDALPWQALAYIRLTEEDTTSSSRIFIKILFQELSEHLGLRRLKERLSDPIMLDSFDGIFPKDNPKNTRFAINFFTSIGLGGLTDNLREYLKNMPRLIMEQHPTVPSGGGDSSESESESFSHSDSSSTSTDGENRAQRRKKGYRGK